MGPTYRYSARVVSVYDGDTVTLDIDLGFRVRQTHQVRLHGINAPELRGDQRADGISARDYLRDLLTIGTPVVIDTFKDRAEKYGRYLARIHVAQPPGVWVCVNDLMVSDGMAVRYMEDGTA